MDDPPIGEIRVKAVCVFTHGGRMLGVDGFDPTSSQHFWVPVGGKVEFGESSDHAVIREIREELDAEVSDLRLLGVLENIFTLDGGDGHEVVFVYDARFVDGTRYEREVLTVRAGDVTFFAHWIDPLATDEPRPLYPDGLARVIERTR